MKTGKIHIGTSGWHYKHWVGKFYPDRIRATEQLDYYLQFFNTVEINNSFYRLPSRETFSQWKENTPPDFLFSIKASRYITHMKKLKDARASIDMLLNNAIGLNNKLSTILFQLPPDWNINVERFQEFLDILPTDQRFVFEFRNHSWYTQQVYRLLTKYGCAFCIYELAGHTSPIEETADFVYIRLHGPADKYQGSYDEKVLQSWADKLTQWSRMEKDVYVYFDNDQNAFAAFNALTLKDMIM